MKHFLSIFFCTLLLLLLFTFCGGILLFDEPGADTSRRLISGLKLVANG